MAKALELNADTLKTAPPVPRAAKASTAVADPKKTASAPKKNREPLQVRWPAEDVKAAKLAAIQLDFHTLSDFLLACFHAYMKQTK